MVMEMAVGMVMEMESWNYAASPSSGTTARFRLLGGPVEPLCLDCPEVQHCKVTDVVPAAMWPRVQLQQSIRRLSPHHLHCTKLTTRAIFSHLFSFPNSPLSQQNNSRLPPSLP